MSELARVLMERDGLSYSEAEEQIQEARNMIFSGEYYDPEECLAEQFGLEPDYVFDLFD